MKITKLEQDIENDTKRILKETENILSDNSLLLDNKDIVIRRCFTEKWFSDTLSWLLNPKGSHQLGVKFSNLFLQQIGKIRSGNADYKRRDNMLKWGKGIGTSATNFSLKNASSIREFYLSKSIKKRDSRDARYCDVVFLDLDLKDGLFVVIENKLFTNNHNGQLEEYYTVIEDKFSRVKIREYVYLTLDGMAPRNVNSKTLKCWVKMSWSKDILGIIDDLKQESEHKDIVLLRHILEWVNKLKNSSISNSVLDLRKLLLKVASICLIKELNKLGTGKQGNWIEGEVNTNHISIIHSSVPKKPLFVELLPNFTITVQSRTKKKALFDKIIVPFGVHPDQIFNLIEITARDVYYYHFEDSADLYLADKRRSSSSSDNFKKGEIMRVLSYIYQNQYELKVILASSKYVSGDEE
ncbi:PD-(D/E)XK nuclease family protein (plasmid) [Tenacibaculum finnmarkense]|uniref:PD-(D/E)XK nuclease family protein n=1 Tax=Tenacibaculum finnmarkense TaxID=2781243 RepID=UPI00187BAB18|nr:PD-(D/E)XK nuclease family protein [Tenacibaculum finnmarkense]MBE7649213.1 hypothetical protein [Tenacibaculum finnmarkense genomovar ulcerans]MCD8455150.1 PD-(D/E)XK nuclease family protein [Tenacibaculum finnmarkense genomovar ulcerans]WCC43655.1 PD-(D/E)XK nuclease family protein [Tenacibaculum finnmarkense]